MSKFKIAYNLNGFRKSPLKQSIEDIARLGYDGVELSIDEAHFHPHIHNKKDIKTIKEIISSCAIKLTNLHTGAENVLSDVAFEPSFITPNAEGRAKRMNFSKDVIDLAVELGTDIVCVASGFRLPDLTEEEAWEFLFQNLGECVDYGKERGVLIALEPEPGMLIETSTGVLKAINGIKSGQLVANLDVGHVFCANESIRESILLLNKHIKHIHIEDIKKRKHYHEIPGTGDINFDEIFDSLKEIDYGRFVSVELYTYADTPYYAAEQSMKYLGRYFRR